MSLQQQLLDQNLSNGYVLVNGVEMNAEMGDRFKITNPWFRKNVGVGHFVELRIDSPRFSAHPDAPANCECSHCQEPAENPILCHVQPASLSPIPKQTVPSRGWGEQFWAKITERDGRLLAGTIDNPLYESKLHSLSQGDTIYFREDHILVVHGVHNEEIIRNLNEEDLAEFGQWDEENHG
ncbi:MAG: hypothetical protein IH991_08760 [Planctomycetes bacterium]|nr:hypothetical protein [Planctomycetota bacterium]